MTCGEYNNNNNNNNNNKKVTLSLRTSFLNSLTSLFIRLRVNWAAATESPLISLLACAAL
jgi:hypothetical protein